ncbi:DUF4288 domain-containing protein [Stenotrophobium rhamnosiphilum]|uniref:DUF4288 domain-containing protein n=1 Tax=Stenotrophobium rhamnosiphilum TaxID=2029166 RepID=A0A2T5MBM9_9GAMM|nr:DUF4288 domain-containing protein [Stenotrophobium rhamnosiphilum]PTU29149.1 hypothetical protein CJD38_17525 [Stenotrophobium rhamnosiphilum]
MKNRYAAKLLFQFRIVTSGRTNKVRDIEERIIICAQENAELAYKYSKSYGIESEYHYKNDSGGKVFFEFIGVIDLLHLGNETTKEEVWYDIRRAVNPMERRKKLVPAKHELSAFRK